MKEPTYRQALGHAWQLVWQHKILWVFGLFAAMLGQMGLGEFLSKISFFSYNNSDVSSPFAWWEGFREAAASGAGLALPAEGWVAAIWLLVIGAALAIGFIAVATISQGALIHSTAQSVRKRKLPDAGHAWHAGVTHFWRIFWLMVLRIALFVVLGIFIGWAAMNAVNVATGWDALLYMAIFVLAALVGIVITFLTIYAAGYVIVEEYSFIDAIHAAWLLFREHRLVSLEVGVILLLCNFLVVFLSLLGVLVFYFPAVLLWIVALALGSSTLMTTGFAIGSILFIAYLLFLGATFSVFSTSAWTYLFMKMHKHGVVSRVHHWLTA